MWPSTSNSRRAGMSDHIVNLRERTIGMNRNERKTVVHPSGSWWVKDNDGVIIPWTAISHGLYSALCKLRDYANTGLSPDEVERLANKEKP